jgi:hypothetical protein
MFTSLDSGGQRYQHDSNSEAIASWKKMQDADLKAKDQLTFYTSRRYSGKSDDIVIWLNLQTGTFHIVDNESQFEAGQGLKTNTLNQARKNQSSFYKNKWVPIGDTNEQSDTAPASSSTHEISYTSSTAKPFQEIVFSIEKTTDTNLHSEEQFSSEPSSRVDPEIIASLNASRYEDNASQQSLISKQFQPPIIPETLNTPYSGAEASRFSMPLTGMKSNLEQFVHSQIIYPSDLSFPQTISSGSSDRPQFGHKQLDVSHTTLLNEVVQGRAPGGRGPKGAYLSKWSEIAARLPARYITKEMKEKIRIKLDVIGGTAASTEERVTNWKELKLFLVDPSQGATDKTENYYDTIIGILNR